MEEMAPKQKSPSMVSTVLGGAFAIPAAATILLTKKGIQGASIVWGGVQESTKAADEVLTDQFPKYYPPTRDWTQRNYDRYIDNPWFIGISTVGIVLSNIFVSSAATVGSGAAIAGLAAKSTMGAKVMNIARLAIFTATPKFYKAKTFLKAQKNWDQLEGTLVHKYGNPAVVGVGNSARFVGKTVSSGWEWTRDESYLGRNVSDAHNKYYERQGAYQRAFDSVAKAKEYPPEQKAVIDQIGKFKYIPTFKGGALMADYTEAAVSDAAQAAFERSPPYVEKVGGLLAHGLDATFPFKQRSKEPPLMWRKLVAC